MLLQFLDTIPKGCLTTAEVSIARLRASRWHRPHPALALLVGYSDVRVRLIQLRVGPLW